MAFKLRYQYFDRLVIEDGSLLPLFFTLMKSAVPLNSAKPKKIVGCSKILSYKIVLLISSPVNLEWVRRMFDFELNS